jgi:arylsulfatase A-like enzyme
MSEGVGRMSNLVTYDNGLRYTNMHTTALCSPSRGAILTGRNHHSLGLATISETSTGYPGYNAILPFDKGMLSEMLLPHGYNTFMVGKWHLAPATRHQTQRHRSESRHGAPMRSRTDLDKREPDCPNGPTLTRMEYL